MKKMQPVVRYALLLLLAVMLLPSCKKENWQKRPAHATGLDGVWQSEGYGYVLDIKNGMATAYDITSGYGVKKSFLFDFATPDTRTWDVALDGQRKSFIYRSKNLVTHFRFNRLPHLPKQLKDGGLPHSEDPLLNFDVLWQTINEHYSFFGPRQVDWQALRNTYRPQVPKLGLEATIKAMLTHLNEDHVTLSTTSDDFLSRFDAGAFRTLRHFAADLPAGTSQEDLKLYAVGEYQKIFGNIAGGYLQNVQTALDNQLMWGSLDAETGYLLVGQMAGYELADLKTALDAIIPELQQYQKLVLDLRANLGGSDRVTLELAGRFVNSAQTGWLFSARDGKKQTPVQTVVLRPTGSEQFVKPIRILTSIATSSAAEVFTMIMKGQPYVKSIGEPTNGIFSSLLTKELPNGWRFSLSNEVLTDMQGRSYEVTGIAPDISQTALPAAAERDSGIDPLLSQYKTWF
jgi:hypothetical protein